MDHRGGRIGNQPSHSWGRSATPRNSGSLWSNVAPTCWAAALTVVFPDAAGHLHAATPTGCQPGLAGGGSRSVNCRRPCCLSARCTTWEPRCGWLLEQHAGTLRLNQGQLTFQYNALNSRLSVLSQQVVQLTRGCDIRPGRCGGRRPLPHHRRHHRSATAAAYPTRPQPCASRISSTAGSGLVTGQCIRSPRRSCCQASAQRS